MVYAEIRGTADVKTRLEADTPLERLFESLRYYYYYYYTGTIVRKFEELVLLLLLFLYSSYCLFFPFCIVL